MTVDHDLAAKAGPSRRTAIGAALGLGVAATLASGRALAALDPGNPDHARLIYRKMRYRTDSGMIFAWVKGPHLAEVGADLTPMYGINLGSIQRITQRPDGGFDVRALEINFLTDVSTGRRLTEFRNPITGETAPVPVRRPKPSTVSYSRDNDLRVPSRYQGMDFEVTHYPPDIFGIGDDVFMRERTRARLSKGGRTDRILNEISTFSAPRAVVLDPKVTSVGSKVQSNDVTSWPAWLKMGATPGILALYAVGGKAPSFHDMPADWLETLHEVWPDIAAAPIAALDAPIQD